MCCLCSVFGWSQTDTSRIIINRLPDTIGLQQYFQELSLGFAVGSVYEPDSIKIFFQDSLISTVPIPKQSISTISEMVSTPDHNGSGYTLDNGFGITNDLGYYLKDNGDGSFQLNDWTSSLSGDVISSNTLGMQPAVELVADSINQRYFSDPALNTNMGNEIEVYHNGLRLFSNEYIIDTTSTNGIILNTGVPLGDKIIIDID